MTMRRLSVMFVLVAALAGCSSGSSNVASSKSTSPTVASPTTDSASPTSSSTSSPTSSEDSGGGATTFCAAFKELDKAKGAATPAAAGAAFRSAAADMHKSAPAAIKDAAETYASLIDTIGKAAQSGAVNQQNLLKELAKAMAGKAQDIGTVAVWVSRNCHL
jgi:hypothetical protein